MYPMAVVSLELGMGEYQAASIEANLIAVDESKERSFFLESETAAQVPVLRTRASNRRVGFDLPSP